MFDLQGHRGARGLFPENTMEGFRAAMARGWRSFELDVAITRDGVPVVHHDPALNPVLARSDGAWIDAPPPLIRDLTFDELGRYDVGRIRPGTTYAELFSAQVPVDGAAIPRLQDVLGLEARFNVELKLMPGRPELTVGPEEMVERVIRVVDRVGAGSRVTIESFDWRAPRYVRRIRPDLPRGWLTEASDPLETIPAAIAEEGGGTWSPHYATLEQTHVERAHALAIRVIPWTVNEADTMRRLVGWGVDGLITDRPDRMPSLPP